MKRSPKRSAHKRRKAMKIGQAVKIIALHKRQIKSLQDAVADLEAMVLQLMKAKEPSK